MSTFTEATEARKSELSENYRAIIDKINQLNPKVNLVAVSKIKPSSDIKALYDAGVRHFGENYVQELIAKSQELPKDIKWHFIGGLQSGKAKDLAKHVESLYAVETIDSLKKCKQLDNTREKVGGSEIKVFLQINTSCEEQKSGYNSEVLDDLEETVKYLLSDECKKLKLIGLMTIGSFSESTSESGENQDFKKLVEVKEILDKKYQLDLELSMGMSNDFEQAIKQGSTSVRVGSSIFGARPPRNAA
ncbi:uncharacterized protein SPAPADRAFT_133045 [Spathaspora passalidarum NRRL Y-27907]|uniref:Pyridoxal phosphate homeostasis protein n=1 Tax=Spathaspora passalidarum (strain NRRL Y-27907 / 11-Y1) TaxID=619300 RepID=G3AG70_SPAPN|nr:uncharacterized protein SPAPADRAFT_133045 [Spathaspora passalidarum NRRL Y-27907]EGW35209.1 hypothetical protein SPAPADRAFT_133045 [Spathaspora passalidarum NRRL Y-27907]